MGRILGTFVLTGLLLGAGCDKPDGEESQGTTTHATTAEPAVGDLLAKLPDPANAPKSPTVAKQVPVVQFFGKFGRNAGLPTASGGLTPIQVDAKAIGELNIVGAQRVESAFVERDLISGESVIVQFGGADPNDGLLLTVRYAGRSASRPIVPANNGPELVSNLDHTVDRLLDELGVTRRQ